MSKDTIEHPKLWWRTSKTCKRTVWNRKREK